jgi:hypothetical protein
MITGNEIYDYLMDNYGECRHDEDAMAAAINDMVVDLDYDNEWDLFLLLVENKPVNSLMTHSYGFHTANGRNIIETIKEKYYGYESVN